VLPNLRRIAESQANMLRRVSLYLLVSAIAYRPRVIAPCTAGGRAGGAVYPHPHSPLGTLSSPAHPTHTGIITMHAVVTTLRVAPLAVFRPDPLPLGRPLATMATETRAPGRQHDTCLPRA